jgi:hypothetical protein
MAGMMFACIRIKWGRKGKGRLNKPVRGAGFTRSQDPSDVGVVGNIIDTAPQYAQGPAGYGVPDLAHPL